MSTIAATRTCSVDECESNALARNLCAKHYRRLSRHGTTDPPPRYASPAERLTASLEHKPNGCLEWTNPTDDKGYGSIYVDGKLIKVHRFAWTLANGPIPDGMNVLHHCDNPPCCETAPSEAYPEGHLFLGTLADNNADMRAKGRARTNGYDARTHCVDGHPYDEANTVIRTDGARDCRICLTTKRHARYLRTGT